MIFAALRSMKLVYQQGKPQYVVTVNLSLSGLSHCIQVCS